jgi:excisionase family DNA binding protein
MNASAGRGAEIAALLSRLAKLLTSSEDRLPAAPPETPRATPERVLLTVEEAAGRLGIGRTTAFALVKSGEIASVQIGRLRRVSADAVSEYAARLVADQHHQRKAA